MIPPMTALCSRASALSSASASTLCRRRGLLAVLSPSHPPTAATKAVPLPTPSALSLSFSTLSSSSAAQQESRKSEPPPPAPSSASLDPYRELGVAPSASQSEIRAAFYRLSKQLHPDVVAQQQQQQQQQEGQPPTLDRYKRISQAYSLVGNPAARKQYDSLARLRQRVGPGRPTVYNAAPPFEHYQSQSQHHSRDSEYDTGSSYDSNGNFVAVICGASILIAIVQYARMEMHREKILMALNARDQRLSNILADVKQTATFPNHTEQHFSRLRLESERTYLDKNYSLESG